MYCEIKRPVCQQQINNCNNPTFKQCGHLNFKILSWKCWCGKVGENLQHFKFCLITHRRNLVLTPLLPTLLRVPFAPFHYVNKPLRHATSFVVIRWMTINCVATGKRILDMLRTAAAADSRNVVVDHHVSKRCVAAQVWIVSRRIRLSAGIAVA